MAGLPRQKHPNLLVGLETGDDAGVYRLTPEIALIQTVDFFTPIVNDPYLFGQIAAANALSDVYAMGGRPLTAMNILCVSFKAVSKEVLQAILAGGIDTIHEAGALLVGGHSVEDQELKYGLAVTGVVHPDKILTNAGAQVGDSLILTKPLGAGIIATASKGRLASPAIEARIAEVMRTLNRIPEDVLAQGGIHAATDITGFGFFGHALEMAGNSNVIMTVYASQVPVLDAARDFARMGLIPAGSFANRRFCASHLQPALGIDPLVLDLLSDPQTNGGLLLSVSAAAAADIVARFQEEGQESAGVVGEITASGTGTIRLEV
ncbi:Selenide, water dikinase [Desulfobacca acetoxidans DSM 11109]|uniref:Selenide, water dikinase n=1 Tax=Desulfobacca acetoxidans (strain ATCC 700848 / DSM 11109 / ASRB2) TaxID=880072 RepID=F2NF07_DESAR|nr:Selenide, water dikinase [Desulfobacca acetoxidans DSM 11109]